MKNYRNILWASVLGATMLSTTSCRDDFADINSSPTQVTKAEPSYLFAQAVMDFEPYSYTYWFYDEPMLLSWSQWGVPTGSYTDNFKLTTAVGGVNFINVLKYAREIEYVRSTLSEEDAAKHAATAACVDVLACFLGIAASDINGDIQFTEAGRGAHEGVLTPAYDRIENLYNLWLEQLDASITTFTTAQDQIFTSNQDVVYRGDVKKWAKLANSLKLRIAARLISQNKAKALEIASQVASASCGYIDALDEAMLFNKCTVNSSSSDYIYHWSNGFMEGTGANQRVIDFMLENRDPRVRFCYQKNDWNSKIVQEFYDQGKEIPSYIEQNVEYTTDANGKKTFVKWIGMGEPWVRYYGLPVEYNAKNNTNLYGEWYDYSNKYKITDSEGQSAKTYLPFSMFQQQMIIGRTYNFTMPTPPGGPVITKNESRPWYGMYVGGAEVNLYLAEFKLLGANLPKSAEEYYNQGLRLSVQEYDKAAGLNQIAYYGTTYDYDPNEVSIELKAGEIDAMMASEDYQLTGTPAEQLEKVYLQQLLNFTLYPYDQFVTARRSGLPKFNSAFISRENYSSVPVTEIPRRFQTGVPNETSLLYAIEKEAYAVQGYTESAAGATNTTILNSERTWQDKGAPQWGEGPKN
ncbi:SusD/RagB family nutrient-binding outer membrane lipoprotein [Phocaeicola sp.]|uniref:SusD/RagB family nutrient-binding outer membrane lipoprotein n=1 Tax=Phocaeicola sp. TaxID=2773926 RepID=UPI0023D5DD2D|nr:SusD/RagB family nutrient-binding outer membrane lipoprotein [Phocaeicola sp.]MDE5676341.1 SusD/RagB family nutrient-binding outer membrane lipoprotein [Phocaeicola sp.]